MADLNLQLPNCSSAKRFACSAWYITAQPMHLLFALKSTSNNSMMQSFLTLKLPTVFSIMKFKPFFHLSYAKPVQSSMLAIVALMSRMVGFVDPPAKPKLWASQDPVPDVTYSHDLLHRGKQDANVIYPLAIQDASLCPTT